MTRPSPMHLLLPLTLAAGALLPADLEAQRGRRGGGGPPPELENFDYVQGRFESDALGGRETTYSAFLPKGWEEAKKQEETYPLVVWLHGMWEDHDRFAGRGGAQVLDKLAGDGAIPKLILVCAEGDRSSFWTNAVREDSNYEDMVAVDLLAHVTATYPVSPERRERAIAGVSMGGYGALKIALKHPDRFGLVAAHSAAMLPEDPEKLMEQYPWLESRGAQLVASIFGEPLDEDRWRQENVMTIARGLDRDTIGSLKIYFDCGTADRYSFFAPNEQLHELLTERKVPHTWRPVEDGGHGWQQGYNQEAIPHSLRFLGGAMAAQEAVKGLSGLLGGDKGGEGKSGGDGKK